MNLKNVLRTYALLRNLTNDESALLETLRGLSESERELMVQELSPGKVAKKTTAKPRIYEHCARCDKTKGHSFHKDSTSDGYHEFQSSKPKSQRAASLAEQIKSTGKVPRCTYEIDDNGGLTPCDAIATDPIHDKNAGYLGYHEFQPAQTAAATGD